MRNRARTVPIGPVDVMAVTETDVVEHVADAWCRAEGGSIVTVNVDILRAAARDTALADLVADAEVVVPDGRPLVWTAALAGRSVPERVTGASLVWSLAEAAAEQERSVYVIGGDPGVPEAAATALASAFPGLRIAGTDSPPHGFDRDEEQVADLVARVAAAAPDLVLVGLGFPKQERLIARLRTVLPQSWMLGCGAGVPYAAGQFRRAPVVLQRLGAEWLHRLALEPRRLARRYLVHDLPFALLLLTAAVGARLTDRPAPAVALPAAAPAPAPRRRLAAVPAPRTAPEAPAPVHLPVAASVPLAREA